MSESGAHEGTDTTADAPDTGAGQDTATVSATDTDDWGADEWKALAQELKTSPASVRERLKHARQWEQRSKEKAKTNQSLDEAKRTLEDQVAEMRKSLADRDVRDVERSGKLAMTQLRAGLTDAGVRLDDVKDLLDDLDPVKLLTDGEPDDEAIAKRVTAFRKAAGRPTADPDQGKKGGKAPQSMGDVMRSLARRN